VAVALIDATDAFNATRKRNNRAPPAGPETGTLACIEVSTLPSLTREQCRFAVLHCKRTSSPRFTLQSFQLWLLPTLPVHVGVHNSAVSKCVDWCPCGSRCWQRSGPFCHASASARCRASYSWRSAIRFASALSSRSRSRSTIAASFATSSFRNCRKLRSFSLKTLA